jgi:hypothetical protein
MNGFMSLVLRDDCSVLVEVYSFIRRMCFLLPLLERSLLSVFLRKKGMGGRYLDSPWDSWICTFRYPAIDEIEARSRSSRAEVSKTKTSSRPSRVQYYQNRRSKGSGRSKRAMPCII